MPRRWPGGCRSIYRHGRLARGRAAGPPRDRLRGGHGVDIGGLRARQLQAVDFERFDWILCADEANLRDAGRLATAAQRERLALYLSWSGGQGRVAIPDPYTGGSDHFEQVWSLVDDAAKRAVARLLHDADSGIIRS